MAGFPRAQRLDVKKTDTQLLDQFSVPHHHFLRKHLIDTFTDTRIAAHDDAIGPNRSNDLTRFEIEYVVGQQ
jgi:hypothetical protein